MKTEAIVTVIIWLVFLTAALVAALIWARPRSKLHSTGLFDLRKNRAIILITVAVTILFCIVPMGLCPIWNGQIPAHRNQYEVITESFLAGNLHFPYEPSEGLMQMENPYDPYARRDEGVPFRWDHAYYNGRYYMYFGVVPVLFAFLPYRVITGTALTTYHATQLFTAVFIAGLFAFFYQLAKKFFRDISLGMYLFLSVAFSAVSVWCAVSTPALYCTAITAGMAAMVWGMYFWTKGVWDSRHRKQALLCAVAGSFLGALAFGCRPPIAMGNLVILALMFYYLKEHPWKNKWQDGLAFLSPYVVVGVLLMLYNHARFGSVLEFGQSYQLTSVDGTNMPSLFNLPTVEQKLELLRTYLKNAERYLFQVTGREALTDNGTFITFPILYYIFVGLISKRSRDLVRQQHSRLLIGLMVLTPVVILALDVMGSMDVFPRYRMDTFWIFGILAYVFLGIRYQTKTNKSFICFAAILTTLMSVWMLAFPDDFNFTAHYEAEIREFFSSINVGN